MVDGLGHLLPVKVPIGPLEWEIVRAPMTGDEVGRCESRRLTIVIDSDLPDSLYRDTFRHELLHAAIFTFGGHDGDDAAEERIVGVLAPALPGVIAATPHLWTPGG